MIPQAITDHLMVQSVQLIIHVMILYIIMISEHINQYRCSILSNYTTKIMYMDDHNDRNDTYRLQHCQSHIYYNHIYLIKKSLIEL